MDLVWDTFFSFILMVNGFNAVAYGSISIKENARCGHLCGSVGRNDSSDRLHPEVRVGLRHLDLELELDGDLADDGRVRSTGARWTLKTDSESAHS